MLTGMQHSALSFIRTRIRSHGYSPSYDEIMEHIGCSSRSAVFGIVAALEERGFITRMRYKRRAISLTPKGEGWGQGAISDARAVCVEIEKRGLAGEMGAPFYRLRAALAEVDGT